MLAISKFLATWGYSGYSAKMPGTIGSLAALPFIWLCWRYGGVHTIYLFSFVTLCVGLYVSHIYITHHPGDKDPSEIVIDEVSGQALTIALLLSVSYEPSEIYGLFLLGFILFRLFDIFKMGPVKWCDQNLAGSWGIMIDDIVAACVAGLIGITGLILYNGSL